MLELLRHRAAVRLMEAQPLLGRQAALLGFGIVARGAEKFLKLLLENLKGNSCQ